MALLKVQGLGMSFGGLRANWDISFQVAEGRNGRPYRPQRRGQIYAL